MPEPDVIERAHRDAEQGKSPCTQAGEFVREEIDHVRQGKHAVRSVPQTIAIGLSKARSARRGKPSCAQEKSRLEQSTPASAGAISRKVAAAGRQCPRAGSARRPAR